MDLAALVTSAVEDVRTDAAARGIRLETSLEPAVVTGNRTLLAQLVANVLQNAVAHNVYGGWITVSVAGRQTSAELVVANGGVVLDPGVVGTLTEPFVRGSGRARTANGHDGSGLGLAIVESIVRAHHGSVDVVALPQGGLQLRVALPR